MNLTGVWQCDDGATYYVRQIGDRIFWCGESQPETPIFCNVASGLIAEQEVMLQWADVPKGVNQYFGAIILRVSIDGDQMEAIHKSGSFSGSLWNRVDST